MRVHLLMDGLGKWTVRYRWIAIGIALAFAATGFVSDRLAGDAVAYYTGKAQFISVVLYLLYAVALLLFMPYGPRVTSFLSWAPMVWLRIALFLLSLLVSIVAVSVTVTTKPQADSDTTHPQIARTPHEAAGANSAGSEQVRYERAAYAVAMSVRPKLEALADQVATSP